MENINTLIEDPLKIPEAALPVIEPVKKEFDARSFLDKLYTDASESVAKAKAVAIEDTPTDRQIMYGVEQETTLIGNALRYGQALIDSYSYDTTYSTALKWGEYKRQEDIKEKFPEYKYVTEEEESAAMLGGRVGVALLDPATVLVPWIKIAKAGKVASVGINAAIAGVDSATRDKLIHGEVSLVNLGASTVLGGLGGLASAALYGKKGSEALAEIAVEEAAIARVPVISTKIIPATLTASEGVTVAESAQSLFTHADILSRIPEISATGTNLTLRAEPINQMKAVLGDMKALSKSATRKKRITALMAEENKKLDILTSPTSKFAVGTEEKLLAEADTLAARLKILREAPKQPTPSSKTDMGAQIKALEDKIEEATINLYSGHINKATASADMTGDIIEDLAGKGKLTDNILAGLVSEVTRPLIGGIGGFATGVYVRR
jgi:hypothetical protein